MAFKDLLVLIGKDTKAGNHYALWLAGFCDAKLTATSPVVGTGLPSFALAEMPSDMVTRIRDDAENVARSSLDAFSESARQAGVMIETVMLDAASVDVGGEVSRLARYFDATIVQQPDPKDPRTADTIETVLLGSGRPVLIAPYIPVPPQLGTVIAAWDEGRPAARAVADALPLLTFADRVEIVSVTDAGGDRPLPSEGMARHLARHGIRAEAARLVRGEVGIADTLLSHASDVDAGLIVMGGYGHSRLREIVLGGTTRTILQTMTVPVLMSH
jgi:nucleotide-binding universal stress UspA family protein